MSARAQKTLIQHLLDVDSLEILAEEGLFEEAIPDEQMRVIVRWAIDYYYHSGCKQAPSEGALRAHAISGTTFGDILDDHEIPLGEDAEDTIEWAIEDLKATYTHRVATSFNKRFATDMADAEGRERVEVVGAYASELVGLSVAMESQTFNTDLRTALPHRITEYEGRAETRGEHRGMHFGLPKIDNHTYGIHDGELCVLAAPPKTGKSYFLDWVALQEWLVGRCVCLFTLENSVQMTIDRIACMAAGVHATAWQRGECTPKEVDDVRGWLNEVEKSDTPLWVLQPTLGKRSVMHMVRDAQLRECQSLMIDQLTFIEHDQEIRQKDQQIASSLHMLKGLISTGHRRMSCLLAHQINREGQKAADKAGHLEMFHLAESADVERTSDWVFGMYASPDDVTAKRVKFQSLGSRRAGLRHWEMDWAVATGNIAVRDEFTI